MPNNRIIRVDHILKAVSIERSDRQRIYVPRRASQERLQRVLASAGWNCTADPYAPFLHVWTQAEALL